MKNFFRRKNPTLPETPVQNSDNVIVKAPDGGDADDKYSLLITAQNNSEQSVVESILRSAQIPYVIRERDRESWMRVMIGFNIYGTDIFVPESMLDDAAALLVPENDGAENTDAPDNTADDDDSDDDGDDSN